MNNEFENNNAEFISKKENTVDNENSKKAENSVGESASAKRLRMLGDSVSEDIHLKSDEEVKGAFWPNLWFKYKWVIIISSIFLFTFSVFLVQALTKKDYDVYIVYAGPKYLADFQDDYIEAFTTMAEDRNGDGDVNVLFSTLVYLTPEQQKEAAKGNKYEEMAMQQANIQSYEDFQSLMMSGSMAFFLIDPSLYETYKDVFGNVNDILGYEVDSDLLYADNAVYFRKTEFAKNITCFKKLKDDTLLCVMTNHKFTPQEEEDAAIALFKNIMECEK